MTYAMSVHSSSRRHGELGFTVVEIVVVTVAVIVLAAILTPLAIIAIEDARIASAQNDVNAIGRAILKMKKDLGRFPMFTTAASGLADGNADVIRLESSGNTPTNSSTSAAWTDSSTSDTIANQLFTNTPGYSTSQRPAKPFQWRGPYLDKVNEDPWDNKYLVNITNAKSSSTLAAFVISAGPNGDIETNFNLPEASSVTVVGDDLIFRIK